MHNAFDVFVDGHASIKRFYALATVGLVVLAATLLVLARVVTCLAVETSSATAATLVVRDMAATVARQPLDNCRHNREAGRPEAPRARPLDVCRA